MEEKINNMECKSQQTHEVISLKKRIGFQDGKIYLLTSQLQKKNMLNTQKYDEVANKLLEEVASKDEENLKLEHELRAQKSALKLAYGKIHLLQYQLVKTKLRFHDSETNAEVPSLHFFLLHMTKLQGVLRSVNSLPKYSTRSTADASSASSMLYLEDDCIGGGVMNRIFSTAVKKENCCDDARNEMRSLDPSKVLIPADDLLSPVLSNKFSTTSFMVDSPSVFIKNESLLSLDKSGDLSSYSLNTTFDPSFHQASSYHDGNNSALVRTPALDSRNKPGRISTAFHKDEMLRVKDTTSIGLSTQNKKSKNDMKRNELKRQTQDLNVIVLDGKSQQNLNALNHDVNQNSFSVFMSPNSFRANISRIRKENERLRSDIYRFRGKLEVDIFL
jgi:hypothetical protein